MSREVVHTLSPREAQILKLASEGHTDASIAYRLDISEGTVGTYWGRIRTKLGRFSRPELVAVAIRNELTKEIEELERQREALRQELEAAVAVERLFEEIVDAADEGVLLITTDGRIQHANPSALGIFGYELDEIANRFLTDLLPERYRDAHRVHYAEFCAKPVKRPMNGHSETVGLAADGREIELSIVISAVHRDDVKLMTCFIREIE